MADANAYNALLGDYGDPSYWRTPMRQPNALYGGGPVWENNHAAPVTPKQRPADWSVTSGVAEAISPTMGAYGMGAGVGQTYNALSRGDYAGAAEAGLPLAAMAMVPGPKGMGRLPAAAEQPKGIRAYHGSPHDFEKFDASKIGTGEGAQAYGHGLYFAEQEATAKSYRDQLTGSGKRLNSVDTQAKGILDANGGDVEKSVAAVDAMIAQAQKDGWTGAVPEMQQWQERIKRGGFDGRMYEVNIKADPEHFLDWDKPLSQQSEKVRGAMVDAYGMSRTPRPLEVPLGEAVKAYGKQGPEKFSSTLREAGIPGIRYLDQGSRGAGEGSRNYVVFDPATIEILRKYGLLGPMAGGVGVNALYGSENQ